MFPTLFKVILASIFSTYAGADVIKSMQSSNTFRIVLTGQDAGPLSESMGGKTFASNAQISNIQCAETCEIILKTNQLQTFAQIRDQLKLAAESGHSKPEVELPKNPDEQSLAALIIDSSSAEQLYKMMPGPELVSTLPFADGTVTNVKTKAVNFPNQEFYFECQQIALGGRNGTMCAVNAIVPSRITH